MHQRGTLQNVSKCTSNPMRNAGFAPDDD